MVNHGKSANAVKINHPNGTIMIIPVSIFDGIIRVEDKSGKVLYQKASQDANDLAFAIEICKRGIPTGIFETD